MGFSAVFVPKYLSVWSVFCVETFVLGFAKIFKEIQKK